MRGECQVATSRGICGKPAVDSVPDGFYDDGKFHLCAEHWDEINKMTDEEENDQWPPPDPRLWE